MVLGLVGCSGSGGSAPVAVADALTLGEGGTVTTTSDGRDSLLDNDSGLSASASVGAVPETWSARAKASRLRRWSSPSG